MQCKFLLLPPQQCDGESFEQAGQRDCAATVVGAGQLCAIVADAGDELAGLLGGNAVLLRKILDLITFAGATFDRSPLPRFDLSSAIAISLVRSPSGCINHQFDLNSIVRVGMSLSGRSGPSCVMRRLIHLSLSPPSRVACGAGTRARKRCGPI